MLFWLLLLGLILLLFLLILLRAALFRPGTETRAEPVPADIDWEHAVRRLQRMVQIETVSSRDPARVDAEAFTQFRALLEKLYPRLHAACTLERIGENGLLYCWQGESGASPTILMAHYDVVPAEADAWKHPPFSGLRENGELWGRGTLDTKSTLCAALEAAEALLEQGFTPQNDIYFAFGGDEEIAGMDAPAIVSTLEARGIRAALVVDEGGAVVEGVFPGVKRPCALIGTGEKGMLDITLCVASKGGHASAPPPHTPVGVLARAVTNVEKNPFRAQLVKPAREMFDTLGRHSTFLYRMIFANLWCFRGLLGYICKKRGGELNALMRTTCAFTMMQGSLAVNVLPPSASVSANLRLLGGDTVERALSRIRALVNDPAVSISITYGHNPSPFSSVDSEGYARVKGAIAETWPEAIISPYLMVACSDSRHYTRISDHVLRFSAMALSNDDRKRIHGHDERIREEQFHEAVAFYYRLIKKS